MSNPIADGVFYVEESQHSYRVDEKKRDYDDEYEEDYFTPNHRRQSMDASRWHSLFRRMSINVQRDEGTPDKELVIGTPLHPSDHERTLMLNMPIPEEMPEDNSLPSVDEVNRENKNCVEKKSYFEHPFESESSSMDETVTAINPPPESKPIVLTDEGLVSSPVDLKHEQADQNINKTKMHWMKAYDKVRMVNTLGTVHKKTTTTNNAPASKYPLATYYPPAFLPAYLSLCKDEHGRRAPPILFDALNVSITDSESESTINKLWSFRIELQYGEIKWVIKRSIVEFNNFHLYLKFKSSLGFTEPPPSFPNQLAHLTNAALASMRITRENEEKEEVWTDIALKRRDALESYLKELIQRACIVVNYDLCEFLELSALSIIRDMGWKGKEGYLEYNTNPASPSLFRLFHRNHWVKEWLILRDSYIAFCKSIDSTTPADVLLFDKDFKVTRAQTFGAIHQTHFYLKNSSRHIEIKAPTSNIEEWIESLEKVQKESPWVANHRFGSFAPIRENAKAKWFVDGHDYYEAVAQAILSAKSDIYIEDWWLSPQLYLRRPPKGNEEYRLDRLLKRKASEGVMIYIVIYKNLSVALPLDSQYTRDWMQNVHPNIIVQRHANLTSSPFWAHHEKILVIDYRLAFVGGLDLCFGRYDTPKHDLTDYSANEEVLQEIFPGQDYSNPRVKDFQKVSQYGMELIDKRTTPRMPWHDIHLAMTGSPARDIARHFIQRWNFIKSNRAKDIPRIPYLLPKGEYVAARDESKFRGTCRVQVLRSSAEWSQGISREFSIYNAYMECISKAKHFIYIENQFFITTTAHEDKLIKNKIGQAIVERIKRAHREHKKFRVIVVIPVAPGFEGDFVQVDRRSMPLRSVAQYQYRSICRGKHSIFEQLNKANIPIKEYIGFYSLRNWGRVKSTVTSPTSSSIRDDSTINLAMMNPVVEPKQPRKRTITKKRSKSRYPTGSNVSRSGSGNSDDAFSSNQDDFVDSKMEFVTEQVYIHSKLMIVDDKTVVCGSANLNDRSQLGNRDSEIAVIIEDTDLVDSRMDGQYYQASRYALSLRMQLFKEHLGLFDTPSDDFNLHGYRNMRREDIIVMDPLHDEFYYDIWDRTAKKNTLVYRDVFHCVPDDTVHNAEQHRNFVPDATRIPPGHIAEPWKWTYDKVQARLEEIRGHLVEFPTEYLKNTNMTASVMQEAVPPIVFT